MADVIKEFLVKLGFKLDEDGVKKFQAGISSVGKEVVGLGLKATAAATTVTAAVTKIAEQYEELYFASIRTGASAAALTTFAFGSKAIGISAEQSAASLERLNIEMRSNPGKVGLLNMLGIQTAGKNTKEVYDELIKTLAKLPDVLKFQYGAQFGMSPSEIIQRTDPKALADKAEAEAITKRRIALSGLDIDALAAKSEHFGHTMSQVSQGMGLMWDTVAAKWLPGMDDVAGQIVKLEDYLLGVNRATDGWTNTILALASALGGLKAASWLLSFLPGGVAAFGAGATGLLATAGAAAVGVAGTFGALFVPTNKSDEADLYKRNPKTGQMELTEAGRTGLGGGGAFGSSASGAGGGGSGSARQRAMRFFMSQGWSKEAAAGIVANFEAESGNTPHPTPGDSGQAYGAGQWHPDRQRNFKAFAGKDIRDSTLEEQWAFKNFELTKGKEQAAGNALRGSTSAAQAGALDSMLDVRPRDTQGEALKRARLAKSIFDTDLTPGNGGGAGGGDKNVTVNQTNNVTIHGAGDAEKTGVAVKREFATSAEGVSQAGTAIR